MPTHLLNRRRHSPRPALPLMEGIALEHGRTHEACGPARHRFALWLAAAATGPVLWLSPPRGGRQLNPDGLAACASPARFLFVQAARTEDQLWAMEEALRSGAAALVVAELSEPPAMTPVRRLHLAAEAGGRFGPAPLGLLLTPGQGGAQGIESRWHLAPAHHRAAHNRLACDDSAGSQSCWSLQRLRARTLPPCSWLVLQAAAGGALRAVPASPAATDPALTAQGLPQALPHGQADEQTSALPHPQAALAAPAPP
ncbi:ImuA family protein [Leisingera sp. D0M16]|uniref:ImuA family protein n=1 Tax=Leisingera coralii TaxID=3351347 RepID=UPI003B7B98EF